MKNTVQKNIDREASTIGDNIVYAGFLTILFYGFGLADRDDGAVAGAVGFWALFYVVYAPYLVRSIRLRDPPGDTWRAAAYVAYGALPLALYVPFWTELTAWPVSIAAYPFVAIWGSAALVLASLNLRRRGSARRRAAFLGVAGALFAFAAGPFYLGLIFAAFTGRWSPPEGGETLVTFAFIGGAPFAWMAAYAAIELLGRANRPEEIGDEAAAGEPPTV